nr:adipokinetic hormone [Locusta sp.]
ELNFTPNWGT